MNKEIPKKEPNKRLIEILEKQKQDLVVRVLKKHEEVIAGKEFTDRILTSLADLFFLLTDTLNLAQANQEFYRISGYSEHIIDDLTLKQLVPDDDYKLICAAIEKGEFNNIETHLLTRNQKSIPINLKGTTYTTESGRILHMLIASNKSDFYSLMHRMQEAQEQLGHSERLASIGEMAAGIGHELTQPLNTILLFSRNCLKFLEDPVANQKILEENLNIIIDRVDKASAIIRSLKGFATKSNEQKIPVDINSILRDILHFLDPQLKLAEVVVDLDLYNKLPEVLGQEVKLEQVFLNIIQNAIQAMGNQDSPHLIITTSLKIRLEPETFKEKLFVVISITDNGEGMSEDLHKKIFDPFFTTREVGVGMGLGLAIVDKIIQELKGHIKVDSSPGKSTCFSIYLPAHIHAQLYEEEHGVTD